MCDYKDHCKEYDDEPCDVVTRQPPVCFKPLKGKKAPVVNFQCSDGLCAELSLMLDVFNSCIETKTLPIPGSPCQEKIIELLKRCGQEPTALKVRGA